MTIRAEWDTSQWWAADADIRHGLPRAMRKAVTSTATGAVDVGRDSAPVLTGRLRDSIVVHQPQQNGAGWEVMIGPTGERVSLYSKKEENRARFMSSALGFVNANLAAMGIDSIRAEIKYVD